jgi:hypothetical protein
MSWRDRAACIAADLALAGIAFNLIALIVTPLIRPDIDPLADSLSYYAVGPWALVQTGAFAAIGIGSMALAIALSRADMPLGWRSLCSLLLGIAGVASLGLIWFPMGIPMPATFIGDMHQTAGTIAGVAQLAAALVVIKIARICAQWRPSLALAAIVFALSLAGAILSQLSIWWPNLGIPMGATMRLAVLPLLVLWAFIAWRISRRCWRHDAGGVRAS